MSLIHDKIQLKLSGQNKSQLTEQLQTITISDDKFTIPPPKKRAPIGALYISKEKRRSEEKNHKAIDTNCGYVKYLFSRYAF